MQYNLIKDIIESIIVDSQQGKPIYTNGNNAESKWMMEHMKKRNNSKEGRRFKESSIVHNK